eukprot:jgi/Hompol1/6088/HPOL_004842-RA
MLLAASLAAAAPGITGYDFSRYPAADKAPPPNPDFLKAYDFSKVPAIPPKGPISAVLVNCPTDRNLDVTGICDWECTGCTRPADIINCPASTQWGLTYDDGPSFGTPIILDYLRQRNLKATFCIVGSRVMRFHDLLIRVFNEGHQLCVHSWSHYAMTTEPTDVLIAEFEYTAQIIEQVVGQRPVYWRPPYGDVDDRVRAIAEALGMRPIIWSHDSTDYPLNFNSSAVAPGVIPANFADWVRWQIANHTNGSISLEHDLSIAAASQSPASVDNILAAGGITPMSVAECLGDPTPYKNKNVKIPPSGLKSSTSVLGVPQVPFLDVGTGSPAPPPLPPNARSDALAAAFGQAVTGLAVAAAVTAGLVYVL